MHGRVGQQASNVHREGAIYGVKSGSSCAGRRGRVHARYERTNSHSWPLVPDWKAEREGGEPSFTFGLHAHGEPLTMKRPSHAAHPAPPPSALYCPISASSATHSRAPLTQDKYYVQCPKTLSKPGAGRPRAPNALSTPAQHHHPACMLQSPRMQGALNPRPAQAGRGPQARANDAAGVVAVRAPPRLQWRVVHARPQTLPLRRARARKMEAVDAACPCIGMCMRTCALITPPLVNTTPHTLPLRQHATFALNPTLNRRSLSC